MTFFLASRTKASAVSRWTCRNFYSVFRDWPVVVLVFVALFSFLLVCGELRNNALPRGQTLLHDIAVKHCDRWDDLQGDSRREAIARTHNVVFSQLASIAFNMLECGVEGTCVRRDVTRKCRESQLGEAQVFCIVYVLTVCLGVKRISGVPPKHLF